MAKVKRRGSQGNTCVIFLCMRCCVAQSPTASMGRSAWGWAGLGRGWGMDSGVKESKKEIRTESVVKHVLEQR